MALFVLYHGSISTIIIFLFVKKICHHFYPFIVPFTVESPQSKLIPVLLCFYNSFFPSLKDNQIKRNLSYYKETTKSSTLKTLTILLKQLLLKIHQHQSDQSKFSIDQHSGDILNNNVPPCFLLKCRLHLRDQDFILYELKISKAKKKTPYVLVFIMLRNKRCRDFEHFIHFILLCCIFSFIVSSSA